MSTTITPWETYKPDGGLVLSEANGSRSRSWGKVPKGTGRLMAGTPMTGTNTLTPVAAAGEATTASVLLYSIDATNADVEATVMKRDCELNEAYLITDGLNTGQVMTALNALGIIIRSAVLAAPGGTYGIPRATDPAVANTPYGPGGNASIGAGFMSAEEKAEAEAEAEDSKAARETGSARTHQPPPAHKGS
jgi:hypothetical protein